MSIELSVEAIKDLQVCERYFDYKYIDRIEPYKNGRQLLADRFDLTLKRVAAFFFYKKQGGVVPSYNALLNRWERLWFPKDMKPEQLITDQHEITHGTWASYSNTAVSNLIQFYEDFADDTSEILLIDEDFIYPGLKDIKMQGKFDLVQRKDDVYTIIKWSGRVQRPPTASLTYDFVLLKQAFAYRHAGRDIRPRLKLYDLASSKPGFISMSIDAADVAGFNFWAKHARDNEVFIPRRGFTSYCKGCPFDKECKNWNGWPSSGG